MYLVADWAELACLLDEDGRYTGARFAQARGQGDQFDAAAEGKTGRDEDPQRADERLDEPYGVWRLLSRRAADFGPHYPFEVDAENLTIETRKPTRMRRVYAFLLAAANLDVFEADKPLLTTSFERMSKYVIAAMLPHSGVTEIFGTAAHAGSRYKSGNMVARLRRLAKDIGSEVTDAADDVSPHASGDGGLDIVGYPRLLGPRSWKPVIFGQCACGKDWSAKQQEVASDTWEPRFVKTFQIVPVTMIPYAFDNEDGGWHSRWEIRGPLIDRRRWMVAMTDLTARAYADLPVDFVDRSLPGMAAE
jgi:hypothetical protein